MIGYIAYEYGYALNGLPLPSGSYNLPLARFMLFEGLARGPDRHPEHRHRACSRHSFPDTLRNLRHPDIQPLTSRPKYLADTARILDYIASGDIYQANYTHAVDIRTPESSGSNYAAIAAACLAPFNAHIEFPAMAHAQPDGSTITFPSMSLLSASPERFWSKHGDLIETRPIKGTIPRGTSTEDDRRQRRRLMVSAKDRAELLMITDLERNDLGKVAEIGTVQTRMLARLRCAPSVWHLESSVTASVPQERTWVDVMEATFPGGSITGAPKRRAMEVIAGLEHVPRGPYCGAFGWVDARGDADFAIGIRTAVQVGDVIRLNGGGGIVADSDPAAEYEESLVKIAPMIRALKPLAGSRSVLTIPNPESVHA